MKKATTFSSLALAMFVFFDCAEAQKQAPVAAPQNVPLRWLDLSAAGMEAVIQVPATVKIIEDPYDIIIGDGKDIFIEISNTTQSFAEIKSFVEKNTVRGFKKFVSKQDNGFVVEMNPMGQTEFDFCYYATIGTEHYLLKDPGRYHHEKVDGVNAMYGYATSIKAK